jgi:hypothetical protein
LVVDVFEALDGKSRGSKRAESEFKGRIDAAENVVKFKTGERTGQV